MARDWALIMSQLLGSGGGTVAPPLPPAGEPPVAPPPVAAPTVPAVAAPPLPITEGPPFPLTTPPVPAGAPPPVPDEPPGVRPRWALGLPAAPPGVGGYSIPQATIKPETVIAAGIERCAVPRA